MLGQHHGHAPFLGPRHGRGTGGIRHMEVHHIGRPIHLRRGTGHRAGDPDQLRARGFVVEAADGPGLAFHLPQLRPILLAHLHHAACRSAHRHRRPNLHLTSHRHGLHVPLDEVPQAGMNLRGIPACHVQNLELGAHASKVERSPQGRGLTLRQLEYLCAPFRTTPGLYEGTWWL